MTYLAHLLPATVLAVLRRQPGPLPYPPQGPLPEPRVPVPPGLITTAWHHRPGPH